MFKFHILIHTLTKTRATKQKREEFYSLGILEAIGTIHTILGFRVDFLLSPVFSKPFPNKGTKNLKKHKTSQKVIYYLYSNIIIIIIYMYICVNSYNSYN